MRKKKNTNQWFYICCVSGWEIKDHEMIGLSICRRQAQRNPYSNFKNHIFNQDTVHSTIITIYRTNLESKNLPSGLTFVLELNSLLAGFLLFSASAGAVLEKTRTAMSCNSFTEASFELLGVSSDHVTKHNQMTRHVFGL